MRSYKAISTVLDTPWRFKNRAKLHKYCSVRLVRVTSGKDKKGQPKPERANEWRAKLPQKEAVEK
jgi:hypothetical protein